MADAITAAAAACPRGITTAPPKEGKGWKEEEQAPAELTLFKIGIGALQTEMIHQSGSS
jgi:hypothetical protein